MSFRAAEGKVYFTADDDNYRRGENRLKAGLQSVRQTFEGMGRMARNVLLVGGGVVAGLVKLASDAEEQKNKFLAVFKEEAEAAEAFGIELANATNRSILGIREMMSSLQDTFVPLGFARDKARELSQQLTQLAIDVGSFQNKADAEVLRDFQSALVGNHETVRKYGVIITEATLSQQLMAMGLAKSNKDATNQQKVMARLALIMQSTTDAQGDAVRTSGSFANQMRGAAAAAKEAGAAMGEIFLPPLAEVLKSVKDIVLPMAEWVKANRELVVAIGKTGFILAGTIFAVSQLGVAMTALAAHPVVALAAALAMIGGTLLTYSERAKEAREATERLLGGMKDQTAQMRHQQQLDQQRMTRLQKLLATQGRSNDEQTEANRLARDLNNTYGQQIAIFDDMGNAVGLVADAMARMTQAMHQAEIAQVNRQLATLEQQTLDNATAFRQYMESLDEGNAVSRWVKNLRADLSGVYEEHVRQQDALYEQAKALERRKELLDAGLGTMRETTNEIRKQRSMLVGLTELWNKIATASVPPKDASIASGSQTGAGSATNQIARDTRSSRQILQRIEKNTRGPALAVAGP